MKRTYIIPLSLFFFVIFFFAFNKRSSDKVLCFELETAIESNYVEIHFQVNNKVKGIFDVYIHDEEMGYETSSWSEFTGKIEGNKIIVDLTIEIEDNIEQQSETWILKDDQLFVNEVIYTKCDCRED